jgi:hypothetical protein
MGQSIWVGKIILALKEDKELAREIDRLKKRMSK